MRMLKPYAMLLALACLLSACSPAALLSTGGGTDLPLTRATSPDDRVALTFDVTWGKEELTKILTTLNGAGVKATFFVGGTFLNTHPDQVRTMVDAGHEVGTLGQKIQNLAALPEQQVTSNLLASQSALAKILGGQVRYFRPPQGVATPEVVRGARAADLITVTYSLDSEDHLRRNTTQIVERVVRGAVRGDMILLSASDWSKETSKALPLIITGLKKRGFKMVRISDLVPAASAS
jgi:peptidoglycan/xylan/chitin deacetylase (PgdA/CDA1 family)